MNNLDIIFQLLSYEGSPSNNPSDAMKVDARIQETAIVSISRQKIQIADSTTDQVVTLPGTPSEYLVILSDRDVSIKLNGGTEVTQLKTRQTGKKTLVYYSRSAVTGLTISNASGGIASVDIIVANK